MNKRYMLIEFSQSVKNHPYAFACVKNKMTTHKF
jgi:hypothetical protein